MKGSLLFTKTKFSLSALEDKLTTLRENAQRELRLSTKNHSWIPLQVRQPRSTEQAVDMDSAITAFLKSDKKVLLLLGHAASGKTVSTQRFIAHQWQAYQPEGVIPLWISLPHFKTFLNRLLPASLLAAGFTEEEVEFLRQNRKFLVVLDDYDGLRQWQNLYVLNQLERWNVQVIITCRLEYLYFLNDYEVNFIPFLKHRGQRSAYSQLLIEPISPEQIERYLQKTEKSEWQRYRKLMDEVPDLFTLITTSFLLRGVVSRLLSSEKRLHESSQNTPELSVQADIYDGLIEQLFTWEEKKLKDNGVIDEDVNIKPSFWAYNKSLALALHSQGITEIAYQRASELFGKDNNFWSAFFSYQNPSIRLLQTASCLREKTPGRYSFPSNNLLDYFCQRELYPEVLLPALPVNTRLQAVSEDSKEKERKKEMKEKAKPKSMENHFFNRELFVDQNQTVQFFAERVWQGAAGEQFKCLLFALLKASQGNPAMKIAGANVSTILIRAKVSLAGIDLSGLQAPFANFMGGNLNATNLTDADLTGVKMGGAFLKDANLSGAKLEEVDFNELPDQELQAEVCLFHPILPSVLMIGDLKGNLLFFDVKTLEVFQSYKSNFSEIKSIYNTVYAKERVLGIAANLTLGLIASGNQNGSISIWNIETSELLWQFTAHAGKTSALGYSGKVYCICFLKNNKFIVSAGGDNLINIWDVITHTLVNTLKGHASPILCLALDPHSNLMASSDHEGQIFIWDMEDGKCIHQFTADVSSVWKIQFSKKGELLSIGKKDGIKIWDARSWELIKVLGETYTTHVAFALNLEEEYLAIATDEGVVEIWDVVNWKFLQAFLASEALIYNLCFSCDGQHLVLTNKDTKFKIIPINLKKQMHKDDQHFGRINKVCVSHDGRYAASASFDNTIHLWDFKTGRSLRVLKGHQGNVNSICFGKSPILISGGWDKKIIIWDFLTGLPLQVLEVNNNIRMVCICPNSIYLAFNYLVREQDNTIMLFNLENGDQNILLGQKNEINALSFSPDGTKLVSAGSDRTAIVWRCLDGEKLEMLNDHTATINHAQFTADGRQIITAGGDVFRGPQDFHIRVWDSESYQLQQTFLVLSETIKDLALSKDNKWLIIAYAKIIVVWDRKKSCTIATLPHPDRVNSIALTQGKQLLIGCWSGSLYAWDIYEKSNSLTFLLRWFSGASKLYSRNACIQNVKKLSDHNRELLLQREATTDINVSQGHVELVIDDSPNQSVVRKVTSADPALCVLLMFLKNYHRNSPEDAEKFRQFTAKYGKRAMQSARQIIQSRHMQEKNEEEMLKKKNESDPSEKRESSNAVSKEDESDEKMQQAIWMSLGTK